MNANKLQLVVVLLALSVTVACKSSKETKTTTSRTDIPASTVPVQSVDDNQPEPPAEIPQYTKSLPDSFFIGIERTPCFGRCPTYKIWVFQSGYARYEAKKWVDKEGTFETRISKKDMEMLKAKALSIGYYQLKDEYDGPITDIPSTFTAVNFDGRKKSIKARYDTPVKLNDYGRWLEDYLTKLDWQEVKPGSDD